MDTANKGLGFVIFSFTKAFHKTLINLSKFFFKKQTAADHVSCFLYLNSTFNPT